MLFSAYTGDIRDVQAPVGLFPGDVFEAYIGPLDFDMDGDGVADLDLDGDGIVSREELEAGYASMGHKCVPPACYQYYGYCYFCCLS
eukprot:COSAG05_NODE_4147_length_1652_cov_8.323815_1_plen_86_part_10